MEPTDLTIEILRGIRDEVRSTNERLDETNERLDKVEHALTQRIDQTNERLEVMREELSKRIVESGIHTATAIADLAGTVREMTGFLKSTLELRPRVERCEQEIAVLKDRQSRA
jgi:hypothetical protein